MCSNYPLNQFESGEKLISHREIKNQQRKKKNKKTRKTKKTRKKPHGLLICLSNEEC